METTPLLNDELENNDDNLEIFSLIWLDNNINIQESRDTQGKLRCVINHLRKFEDEHECQQYIEKRQKEDRLVIIISDQLGREMVPRIHQLRQVSSIYVYGKDKSSNEQWASEFSKIRAVIIQLDELIARIKLDQKFRVKIEEPLSINMFSTSDDAGASTTRLNGQFVYSQLLIDCLLRLKTNETDNNELISLCEKEYEGNNNQLSIVHEFQRDYSPDKVLWWYSRESFFYKTLNKALRSQNIDVLFLFRSFISDIHRQLQNHKCTRPFRVYRSQLMSSDELANLKQYIGQFISVNSFFSTSTQLRVAMFYMGTGTPLGDLQRVLFEIDADPSVVTAKPFADISFHSEFDSESEVLFMLGSIFRLNNISCGDDQVWIVRMTLCGDEEHDLKEVVVHMQQQDGIGDTNLWMLGKILWQMGKLDQAKKYFGRLLDELSPNDPLRGILYKNLGEITSQQGDYDNSIQWHKKSLEIEEPTPSTENTNVAARSSALGMFNIEEDIIAQPIRKTRPRWKAKQCIAVMGCFTIMVIFFIMVALVIVARQGRNRTFGEKTWANGDRYEGSLKDDKMHGHGTFYSANGEKYVGEYADDKFNGQGVYTGANGDRYEGSWKDGMKHGHGTFYSDNGIKYVGDFVDGKFNGQGVYTWANGDRYEGSWKDGKMHGQGTSYYASGDKYVGEHVDDMQNGQGVYTWADGTRYEGSWKDGKKHGHGTSNAANGDKYVGEYADDKFNGQGVYTKPNGDRYEGIWKDGKKHGHGTFYYADGDKYVGDFADNKRNGEGVYGWADGDRYEGSWKDDMMHGHGTFYSASEEKYVGDFVDDQRNGQGVYTWANGDRYEGSWNDGKKHGHGTFYAADVDKYVGDFADNKRNGQGVYGWTDGDRYEGSWKDDMMHGHGTLYSASGDKYVGDFADGNFNGQGVITSLDGRRYEGSWKDGMKHGHGTFYFASGNKYVGDFADDKRNGQGVYTSANGDRYEGSWEEGQRHGHATLHFGSGDKYVGDFADDKQNGQGVYTSTNGDRYEGSFKDNKKEGQGKLFFANGRVEQGKWINGTFIA